MGTILFSSVVMVLAFQPGGPDSYPVRTLTYLPCIYSFVSLLRTLFIRTENNARAMEILA